MRRCNSTEYAREWSCQCIQNDRYAHICLRGKMCDNPLAHIRIRTARGEISRYWSSYIKLNYLLSSDSIHFLAFSLASRDARLWTRAKTYPPLAALFNCPHTINSLVFFRIGQLISAIFLCPVHICIILREKNAPFLIAYYDCLFLIAFTTISSRYVFVQPTFLSQVRTNGPTTNHSRFSTRKRSFRRKPINPIGRISEALCTHYGNHDTRIRRNVGTLSRSRSTSSRRKREYRENSWTKRKEIDRGEMRGMRRGRRDEACEGEGDAMRLINRHADNHSGFMVTTDYQVVQGGIFHIRDVTLFQWGNTCSARYKLHERAYTRRHVCCIVSALVGSHKRESFVYACMCDLLARTLAHQEDWLSGRRPGARFLSSFIFVQPFPTRCFCLKIIPTFNGYKNTRPLFRESDPLTDHRRHSTPTRYPLSRLERGLLTGAKTSLGVARQSWNFETTRPKGWNCNPR